MISASILGRRETRWTRATLGNGLLVVAVMACSAVIRPWTKSSWT